MKLNKKARMQSWNISNTTIPYLGREQEKRLSNWQSQYINLSSRAILEKTLTIIGNYKFKSLSVKVDKDSNFYFKPVSLQTIDGKTIKLSIGYGDMDNPETVAITEDGIEDIYDIYYSSGELIVEPSKTRELSTGFEQYYDNKSDYFSKTENGIKTYVKIILPYNSEQYVFVNEEIKKQFKETKFNNIIDLYHFLINKLNGISNTFHISTYNDNPWRSLEKIAVKNGKVKEIELQREINGNKVVIRETFSDNQENEALDELVGQVRSLRKTQSK